MITGSNLLTNGDFEVGGTPPNSWTAASTNETISTDTGSGIDASDAMLVVATAAGNAGAYQTLNAAVVPLEWYQLDLYVKALSEATYNVWLRDLSNANTFWTLGNTEETAGDWTTTVQKRFAAPAGCTSIRLYIVQYAAGAGVTMLFDNVSVYKLFGGGGEAMIFQFQGMT